MAMAGCCRMRPGDVVAIREELDASPAERAITLCNSGHHRDRLRAALVAAAEARKRQCQGRILPHRSRGTRGGSRRDLPRLPLPGSGSGGRQRPRPARRHRGELAADLSPPAHAERRDAGRARDGVLLRRHRDRPGRGDRAPTWCSARRDDRRRCRDPRLLPHRGCDGGHWRAHRALCAVAARRRDRRGRAYRQFRRGEEGRRSARAPRPIT